MKIINWFEIPARDLNRAVAFYAAVLNASFQRMEDSLGKHAFFALPANDRETVGGEIRVSDHAKPSADGVTLYFSAPGGVDAALARAERAGARILLPKTPFGESGFVALILDSEGNKIGLYGS